MSTYMIGYDLHPSRGETYEALIKAIKAFGSWWHHLDSTWLVDSSLTAIQIRDSLKRHLPYNDDQVLVIEVSGKPAAWQGFDNNGSQWIKNHL